MQAASGGSVTDLRRQLTNPLDLQRPRPVSRAASTGGVGSTEYQVNWRVDRIRPGDVVFVREDPAQPTATPVTRVLTIRPESEELPASSK